MSLSMKVICIALIGVGVGIGIVGVLEHLTKYYYLGFAVIVIAVLLAIFDEVLSKN